MAKLRTAQLELRPQPKRIRPTVAMEDALTRRVMNLTIENQQLRKEIHRLESLLGSRGGHRQKSVLA